MKHNKTFTTSTKVTATLIKGMHAEFTVSCSYSYTTDFSIDIIFHLIHCVQTTENTLLISSSRSRAAEWSQTRGSKATSHYSTVQ